MSMSKEFIISKFEEMKLEKLVLRNISLSVDQLDVLHELLRGKDVFCQLPTGAGKSLPLFCYPFLASAPVILISPLISLIDSHSSYARSLGLTVFNTAQIEDTECPESWEFLVIGTPESVVNNGKVKEKVSQICSRFPRSLIGVDEAHCIPKWGFPENTRRRKQVAFRAAFGKLGILCSLVSASCRFLLITATATVESRREIIKTMGLRKQNFSNIIRHPVRQNISFVASPIVQYEDGDSVEMSMEWIFEKAKQAIDDCFISERVVVYTQTVADCGHLYKKCVSYLSTRGYQRETWNVDMYHSGILEDEKTRVIADLLSDRGQISVVFATSALGMGVDIKLARYVIIYGIPDGYEDLIQMAGRAGRTGGQATCIIYYESKHWSGKSLSHELRDFLQLNDMCRRQLLIKAFMENAVPPNDFAKKELCCDICNKDLLPQKAGVDQPAVEKHAFSEDQIANFRKELRDMKLCFQQFNWCISDLNEENVELLCKKMNCLDESSDFLNMFNFAYKETADAVRSVFSKIMCTSRAE